MIRPSPRTVIIAIVAVLAAGALGAGGWYWRGMTQQRALTAYVGALTRAEAAQAPQAAPDARLAAIRELESVLGQYPSGPARAAYEVALAQGATRTLRPLSLGAVAYTWEAERNYSKAVEAFKTALTGLGPKDFYYEELLLGLGRAQELAGQKADAIATYQRALGELGQSRRAEEIRARLSALGP
jgi:tetratricopeptide (TPR) repeat protein